MGRWRRGTVAVAGMVALAGCAGGGARPTASGAAPPPRPARPHPHGCRSRTCVGGDPRRRQYFDERHSRYYWFDPVKKRYFWEDGSPYP